MEHTISHLAVIMDGNRRWAKKQGFSFGSGYAKGGFEAVKRTMEFCIRRGIKHLSLYTFSIENLKRSQQEQDFLFDTIVNEGEKYLPHFKEHSICVKFIGDRSLFPARVLPVCDLLENETKDFSTLFVNILFCYGGRQELVSGVKKLLSLVKQGIVTEDQITEETLQKCLWTGVTPDPEIVIRTSGTKRLSNFLLFQSAYSEIYFLDCLWPDITTDQLTEVVDSFLGIKRNFGV